MLFEYKEHRIFAFRYISLIPISMSLGMLIPVETKARAVPLLSFTMSRSSMNLKIR